MERCLGVSERDTNDLIADCRRGDREAFRLLFETYKDRVYSIALCWSGGNEANASDITQQVFLRLFTRIEQFRHDAEFTTWLYRIVVNACLDEQRKQRRFVPVSELVEVKRMSERDAQEKSYLDREVADSVQLAIAGLKPKYRLPILLKYVEGLSYEEIAGALGCSKGTVASRLNRGHKLLARRLGHLRGALAAEG